MATVMGRNNGTQKLWDKITKSKPFIMAGTKSTEYKSPQEKENRFQTK